MSASIYDESVKVKVTLETESSVLPEDLPFHILMLGDWGGNSEFSAKPLSTRKFIEIDRDEFDDVIRKIAPQIELKFDDSEANSLKLIFESLEDFHPDNIFQRLSLFADLRKVRQSLIKPETFETAAKEVRSWFSDSTAKQNQETNNPSESSSKLLETSDLLDQVLDFTQHKKPAKHHDSKSLLSEFINSIIAPHLVKTDSDEQSKLLTVVDEIISDLMRKILHHKRFQQIEAAWRGLHFLVKNLETNNKLKVFLFQVTKDELFEDLASVSDLNDSHFYRLIVKNSRSTISGDWAVVCGNYQFRPNVRDMAALMRIAKVSSDARCPFISQISSEIFGLYDLNDFHENNQTLKIDEESSELKLWSEIRLLPESGYIGLSFPEFIGRLPYGQLTDPTELFSFEELKSQSERRDYLWLNPAFAYTYALATRFSQNQWSINLNLPTVLPDVPLHFYEDEDSLVLKLCTKFEISENLFNFITEQGITSVISFRNEDKIRLSPLQSVSKLDPRLKGKW